MKTTETSALVRAAAFTAGECELFAPGGSGPFLNDYARMLAAGVSEEEILAAMFHLVISFAIATSRATEIDAITEAALTKMRG